MAAPRRDPAEPLRKLVKGILMLRYVWRYPPRHGAWPKYEYIKPWFAALAPATVVDVGVNAGQFLILARRMFPSAAIVGLEPEPALHARLEGYYDDDPLVTLHRCAAGAADGDAEFFVTQDDQNSSLHRPLDAMQQHHEGHRVLRTETVPVRRLDGLLDGFAGPLLVKIDVQGGEPAVLEGLGGRLDDAAALIVEAPFEAAYEGAGRFADIYDLLSARGLTYHGALGQLTDPLTGHVLQEDSVWLGRDPRYNKDA